MKIRKGFVSNSSSSSFIVAIKQDTCLHCGRGSTDIENIFSGLQDDRCDSSQLVSSGLEELIEYYYGYYTEEDDDGVEQLEEVTLKFIEKVKEYNDKGYKILQFKVSHNDEGLKNMILNDKNIIILDRW